MHVWTYFSEETQGLRAEVHESNKGYYIKYYDMNGHQINEEAFPGKSIHYVKDAAENWALGIKNLNG